MLHVHRTFGFGEMKQNVQKTFFYSLRVEHCTSHFSLVIISAGYNCILVLVPLLKLHFRLSFSYSLKGVLVLVIVN